ncbi:MAG: hypothetical protein Q7S74_04770 [Nanoarchaeota archaeon]|nr:hypothetical protein [Nanoarchaeota archaeon]
MDMGNRLIRARVEDSRAIAEAQTAAYRVMSKYNPQALGESVEKITSRIESPEWAIFIGTDSQNKIALGISYHLDLKDKLAYACRWFALPGNNLEAMKLFRRSLEALAEEGIEKILARTFAGDKRVRIYKKCGGFRDAEPEEILSYKEFSGEYANTKDEGRVYLVKQIYTEHDAMKQPERDTRGGRKNE